MSLCNYSILPGLMDCFEMKEKKIVEEIGRHILLWWNVGRSGYIPEGKKTGERELRRFLPNNSQNICIVMQTAALFGKDFCLEVRNNKGNCSEVILCVFLGSWAWQLLTENNIAWIVHRLPSETERLPNKSIFDVCFSRMISLLTSRKETVNRRWLCWEQSLWPWSNEELANGPASQNSSPDKENIRDRPQALQAVAPQRLWDSNLWWVCSPGSWISAIFAFQTDTGFTYFFLNNFWE